MTDRSYEPRFTTLEAVRRALSVPNAGKWLAGGDFENDLLTAIASAEALIVEETGDEITIAAADPSTRTFKCKRHGHLLTDRFAADPTAVARLSTHRSTSGSEIDPTYWEVIAAPRPGRSGRHLGGRLFYSAAWYQVTARWGWLDHPWQVVEAAELQSSRFYARRSAPLGVAGGETTPMYVARLDPDVKKLLASLTPVAPA